MVNWNVLCQSLHQKNYSTLLPLSLTGKFFSYVVEMNTVALRYLKLYISLECKYITHTCTYKIAQRIELVALTSLVCQTR